jgi:hypothetical protein
MGSANNDTKRDFELRIMPSDDQWYWEVITESRRVVARGVADTEPEACRQANDAARKARLIE